MAGGLHPIMRGSGPSVPVQADQAQEGQRLTELAAVSPAYSTKVGFLDTDARLTDRTPPVPEPHLPQPGVPRRYRPLNRPRRARLALHVDNSHTRSADAALGRRRTASLRRGQRQHQRDRCSRDRPAPPHTAVLPPRVWFIPPTVIRRQPRVYPRRRQIPRPARAHGPTPRATAMTMLRSRSTEDDPQHPDDRAGPRGLGGPAMCVRAAECDVLSSHRTAHGTRDTRQRHESPRAAACLDGPVEVRGEPLDVGRATCPAHPGLAVRRMVRLPARPPRARRRPGTVEPMTRSRVSLTTAG